MNPNKKNTPSQQIAERTDVTTNYEGATAFVSSAKLRLYLQASTWMVGEPKFYSEEGRGGNQDNKILDLIRSVATEDPLFALKLADYLRNDLYLRTAPQVILVECSLIPACKPHIRKYVSRIMQRPDDMTACIAYLKFRIGDIGDRKESGSMPAQLKKGIADAFVSFNEYQLQKYNNRRRMAKLVDVMRLVHPRPKSAEQSATFRRLRDNKLATPETWETIISKDGSNKEAWTKAAKVMPYMASLRNLRNLMENDALTDDVLDRLTDADRVGLSKQMPYRFYSAYREIEQIEGFDTNKVLAALQKALALSVKNVPHLLGRTFITADNSYSMESHPSRMSKITMKEIANLSMSILSNASENTMCSVFATKFEVVSMGRSAGIIPNMEKAGRIKAGYDTNGHLSVDYLLENNIYADRIIILSDMQLYDSTYDGSTLYNRLLEYKNRINQRCGVLV